MKLGFPFSYQWKVIVRGEDVDAASCEEAGGSESKEAAPRDEPDGLSDRRLSRPRRRQIG